MEWSVGGLLIREEIRLRYMAEKRLTTTRSISLERKDRLEMGRYELHASGSRVGFFSNGKTRALNVKPSINFWFTGLAYSMVSVQINVDLFID